MNAAKKDFATFLLIDYKAILAQITVAQCWLKSQDPARWLGRHGSGCPRSVGRPSSRPASPRSPPPSCSRSSSLGPHGCWTCQAWRKMLNRNRLSISIIREKECNELRWRSLSGSNKTLTEPWMAAKEEWVVCVCWAHTRNPNAWMIRWNEDHFYEVLYMMVECLDDCIKQGQLLWGTISDGWMPGWAKILLTESVTTFFAFTAWISCHCKNVRSFYWDSFSLDRKLILKR